MATKSAQPEVPKVDVEELLDILEQTLDRTKVMYEQYFLGIQKQAPAQLHSETERRLRDLAQMNIRNTALRYRFATTQQKFGSYNAYWRRTLRQIESGKYIRSLQKLGRKAAMSGEELPDEILNAMPKRMREQVRRDREAALANAARRDKAHPRGEFETEDATQEDLVFGAEPAPDELDLPDDMAAIISEPTDLRRNLREAANASRDARGAHVVSEADSDLDLDAFFAQVAETEDEPKPQFRPSRAVPSRTAPPAVSRTTSRGVTPPAELTLDPTPPPVMPRTITNNPAPGPLPRATTQPRGSHPTTNTPVPRTTAVGAPGRGPARLPNLPTRPTPMGMPAATPKPIPSTAPTAPLPPVSTGARPTPASIPATRPTPTSIPATRPTPTSMPASRPTPIPGIPPAIPALPNRAQTSGPARIAPSQVTRPNPIAPGSSNRTPVPVETLSGPFPREPKAQKTPAPSMRPPVGMTEQDVNTLYSKYIQAKEMVGEDAGPAARDKLLKTIHAQAPKIMEQYKAKGVDFSVVVKDNQVIIRAKPKP